jgi:hypothetical protein
MRQTFNVQLSTSNFQSRNGPAFTWKLNVGRWTLNVCLFIFLTCQTALPATTAPTTSVTQPTAQNLQVVEWAVFVVDASSNQLNPQGWVTSTLPGFVTDHRFAMGPITPVAINNPNGNMVFNGRFWMRINPAPTDTGDSKPQLAETDQPSPVGVIRMIGSADSKVDVSISSKDGSFLGSWPKATERDKQLLWRDLSISPQPADQPPLVAATHWFTTLRSVDSAYLSLAHSSTDRFLLYDLEQPYTSPLKAKADGNFKYEFENQTGAPLHDLTLYQGDKQTWRTTRIGELAASAHPVAAPPVAVKVDICQERLGIVATDVSADPAKVRNFGYGGTQGVFVDSVTDGSPADGKILRSDIILIANQKPVTSKAMLAAELSGSTVQLKIFRTSQRRIVDVQISLPAAPATTMPSTVKLGNTTKPSTVPVSATTTPASRPTTRAAEPAKTVYTLQPAPTTQPGDLADTWKPIITGAGIDPADAALMTRVIARYALDPHRMTAVYRMDSAELDRMLPIEIVPQPAKITRLALVIVINADSSAGTIVDDLIKQLGDDDWGKRDAAYNALASMGPAAQAKLNGAKNNSDLEISWRAERLLGLISGAAK